MRPVHIRGKEVVEVTICKKTAVTQDLQYEKGGLLILSTGCEDCFAYWRSETNCGKTLKNEQFEIIRPRKE